MSDQKCKTCRRAGEKLFLKGEKCFTPKCIFEKRPSPPGKALSERKHRSNLTEYGIQLKEKQKLRNVYGLSEKQFRRYVKEAGNETSGSPVEHLFERLERRLDNVVYRLGLAQSRTQARQMVSHGHIMVGKRKLTIPSYQVKKGEIVSVREGSRTSPLFTAAKEKMGKHPIPNWIAADALKLSAEVKGSPKYDKNELGFNFQSVIEFYSR
ncbi:MAG: 30S ribosomal protein S4 [Candidatus Lloydbacteria bacterium RIFCSPLOWO2_01_FULL_50_20]|uniref:Small ribosomal subunit protein uS4 n=1 Tax=Candidatus Lloydbacteria bacterium RIFCSPLOWO2_01_FULL_50_20 TaxID=1798665 RepID=A0A1G2DEJ2_9BACT|nr:MAG: 30S ribosomal protein S4 [Candidatus Lloydbacteria bacterium RIFCSPHIGHO2_02_FULL_50_11]OGZ11371.1 MAG: 30S ribosomal protein S4 [Candidatus Lloydbacteria bacterium RIFCSPLOWO2_01_FULL_50_20]